MSLFELYFWVGIEHITDIVGYDHILFLITLCAGYTIASYKRILVLITAFTIGHSITLALSLLKVIIIPSGLIEFLIPLTIFITAVSNIFQKSEICSPIFQKVKYFVALFFGLIHGLGFSNYLRSLLGSEDSILMPLFSFNLGLEAGQIIIVLLTVILSYLFHKIFKVQYREWNLVLSGAGIGISVILMIERFSYFLSK
jgi:hypothetical protein